ncbi:MAG: 2-oxo acid dehydrogenase subunit E2 [Bacteroidales bacterium]|nr:2-oxo acid dehydrogenase subunit E2 [Bacteroidales bacterium]
MANVVIMPKQGQSVESCIVTEFKKKAGDKVAAGDILFSYETDKASFDEEAKVEGTVLAVFFKDGDEIPCLTNVMVIGAPGESFAEFDPNGGAATSPSGAGAASGQPAGAEGPDNRVNGPSAPQAAPATAGVISGAAVPADGTSPKSNVPEAGIAVPEGATANSGAVSPRARKLAEEKGVNLAQVAGTGPYGRVIERDVQAVAVNLTGLAKAKMAEGGMAAPAQGSGLAGTVKAGDLKEWKANHSDIAGEGAEFEVVKMSNMRKLIAKSMYNSLQNSAQLTHMLGADARKVQALRKKAKKAFEEGKLDTNITVNDFVCFAVIKALKKFPNLNSHCLGDAMRLFKPVNLGCAVDTERGLMVPAIPHADELNIVGLSKQLKKIAEDAKKGCVNPDLLSPEAASFTVSNLGGFGVEWFTPIINVPQSAILGVCTIVPRPKDLGGGVVAFVPYMGLSLTYDHRAVDGGEATRFLKQVAIEIENLDVEF